MAHYIPSHYAYYNTKRPNSVMNDLCTLAALLKSMGRVIDGPFYRYIINHAIMEI